MMRIVEASDKEELYPDELKERVSDIYEYISNITLLKKLSNEIRKKAEDLRSLILSETELKERKDILDYFDSRVKSSVYYTLNNLEHYKQHSWQKLNNKGETEL